MQANFDKFLDFTLFYDYVNKLGPQIEVLSITSLGKTKLKSNHYWIMVLLTKLTKLRVLKFKGGNPVHLGPDFFKFITKGMNYMAKDGRQLEKFQMNNLIGDQKCNTSDNLYPCLKPNTNLISLNFAKSPRLGLEDARAIGKVLTDFRQIRELDLTSTGLTVETTKEIADGLMRSKQLEILKLGENPSMGTALATVIYNLAFSPKIRLIDLASSTSNIADVAEAIYKLIKISGAIEVLNLNNTGLHTLLTSDFYQALGENKTLKSLNLGSTTAVSHQQAELLGKAVAMNAFRKGPLDSLVITNWFKQSITFLQFVNALYISNKDHELMYGDKKLAKEMEKADIERHMHCNIKFLNMSNSTIGGFTWNYKHILKETKPEWPKILELATKTKLIINLKKCEFKSKDMETIAYMLANNPYGASKITSLNLSRNALKG